MNSSYACERYDEEMKQIKLPKLPRIPITYLKTSSVVDGCFTHSLRWGAPPQTPPYRKKINQFFFPFLAIYFFVSSNIIFSNKLFSYIFWQNHHGTTLSVYRVWLHNLLLEYPCSIARAGQVPPKKELSSKFQFQGQKGTSSKFQFRLFKRNLELVRSSSKFQFLFQILYFSSYKSFPNIIFGPTKMHTIF